MVGILGEIFNLKKRLQVAGMKKALWEWFLDVRMARK